MTCDGRAVSEAVGAAVETDAGTGDGDVPRVTAAGGEVERSGAAGKSAAGVGKGHVVHGVGNCAADLQRTGVVEGAGPDDHADVVAVAEEAEGAAIVEDGAVVHH